jgi:two-component system sensor histidine kinase/response regulator
MVTSYGRESQADESTLEELDGFVLKPVTPSLLFEAIARVLGGESRAAAEPLRLPSSNILVAEDDEINQQVARELLAHLGMRVSLAANGQEALDALAKEPFDLVLMDLQMPVLDGFEATRRIRSDKRWKALPIIAMTAHAMVGDRERCLEVGMNDHLAKPIDPRSLRAALGKWLTAVEGLPALPGVETAQGLARVGGNVKLYRKLLGEFRTRFGEVAAQLRAGSSEEGAALAHKLAGTAGNLGMAGVAAAARALEQATRAGKVENGLLEDVEKSLALVLPALEGLAAEAPVVAAGPVADAPQKLKALLELLREGDPAAEGRLEELTPALVGQPELPSLTSQVNNLDFEEAAQTLERILEVMQ